MTQMVFPLFLFVSSPRVASSETQRQLIGAKKDYKDVQKPTHFQTARRMLALDWAEKSFVLFCPIGEQQLLRYFASAVLFWIVLARETFFLIYFREPQKFGKTFRMQRARSIRPKFRFELPKCWYVEWNGIFHLTDTISFHSHFCSVALALSSANDVQACSSRPSTVPIERLVSFHTHLLKWRELVCLHWHSISACIKIVKSLSSVFDFTHGREKTIPHRLT